MLWHTVQALDGKLALQKTPTIAVQYVEWLDVGCTWYIWCLDKEEKNLTA